MITGRSIVLREWRDNDIPVLMRIRNDIHLQSLLMARPRGSSHYQVRRWLEERSGSRDSLLLIVADPQTDAAVGYIQIVELGNTDNYVELGICLAPEARGSGKGQEAIQLVQPFLAQVWSVHKIVVRVLADNAAAISCYERCGFAKCGIFRSHHLMNGRYHDVVLMERLLD